MKWATLCVSVLVAANFSTVAAQGVPEVAVFSFEDDSCSAWTRSSGEEIWRARYGVWFRGFVSGYNFGNAANQVPPGRMPDPAAVAAYVDKFCRDNPSLSFIAAAIPLVRDNREIPVPAPEHKPARNSAQ